MYRSFKAKERTLKNPLGTTQFVCLFAFLPAYSGLHDSTPGLSARQVFMDPYLTLVQIGSMIM
jgi:hypothetical protein